MRFFGLLALVASTVYAGHWEGTCGGTKVNQGVMTNGEGYCVCTVDGTHGSCGACSDWCGVCQPKDGVCFVDQLYPDGDTRHYCRKCATPNCEAEFDYARNNPGGGAAAPCGSISPTTQPTSSPTDTPTGAPTKTPTAPPSDSPTYMPTPVPVTPPTYTSNAGGNPVSGQPGKRCLAGSLTAVMGNTFEACSVYTEAEACKSRVMSLERELMMCKMAQSVVLSAVDAQGQSSSKVVSVANFSQLRQAAKDNFAYTRTNAYFRYSASMDTTDGSMTMDLEIKSDADLMAALGIATKQGLMLSLQVI